MPKSRSDYCNRTSRFRKERGSKGRLWKVQFRLPGKSWANLSNRKVGSFRRELLGNWKRADRRLVTSTYPLYPGRTAQYIVYLIPVYPSALPVEFHRRSFFFFFLPRLGLRVSSLPVGLHAASWHLIFACIPTRCVPWIYPWMLWKRIPGIPGGISVKSAWILVKEVFRWTFFDFGIVGRVCASKVPRDYLF